MPARKIDSFLRMGKSKNLDGFGKEYKTIYLEHNHFKSRMLEKRNTIPKKKVIIEQYPTHSLIHNSLPAILGSTGKKFIDINISTMEIRNIIMEEIKIL